LTGDAARFARSAVQLALVPEFGGRGPMLGHLGPKPAKKTCKRRPFGERLKGFEPSTFCMAISSSRSQSVPKCLQIGRFLSG
jgi:hypothetical protein